MNESLKPIKEPKTPLDEVQNYLLALTAWAEKRRAWEGSMLNTIKTAEMQEACAAVNEIADHMSEEAWKLFRDLAKQSKEEKKEVKKKMQLTVSVNGVPTRVTVNCDAEVHEVRDVALKQVPCPGISVDRWEVRNRSGQHITLTSRIDDVARDWDQIYLTGKPGTGIEL